MKTLLLCLGVTILALQAPSTYADDRSTVFQFSRPANSKLYYMINNKWSLVETKKIDAVRFGDLEDLRLYRALFRVVLEKDGKTLQGFYIRDYGSSQKIQVNVVLNYVQGRLEFYDEQPAQIAVIYPKGSTVELNSDLKAIAKYEADDGNFNIYGVDLDGGKNPKHISAKLEIKNSERSYFVPLNEVIRANQRFSLLVTDSKEDGFDVYGLRRVYFEDDTLKPLSALDSENPLIRFDAFVR